MARASTELEFANRKDELGEICNSQAKRFIVLDGPGGYGKTRLLGRVQEWYGQPEHGSWKIANVKLKQVVSGETTLAAAPLLLCRAIAQGLSTELRVSASLPNALLASLTRRGGAGGVLILLDGVEVLAPETSAWLKTELIPVLDAGLQRVHRTLRVIFAGRYVPTWWQGAPFEIKTIPLSSFKTEAVLEMLGSFPDTGQLSKKDLDELAWWVLLVSGGHPGAIAEILNMIDEKSSFALDSRQLLVDMDFEKDERRDKLFGLCVQCFIDEILEHARPGLPAALETICCVRRFNLDLLERFIEADLLRRGEYSSSWDLVTALLRDRLVRGPAVDNPMFSDQALSRMLVQKLRVEQPERFVRVTECAQQAFHSWALGQECGASPQIRLASIIESLYHTVQVRPEALRGVPPDREETRAKLETKLRAYIERIGQDQPLLLQVGDALAKDEELRGLIERQAGPGTVQSLDAKLRVY